MKRSNEERKQLYEKNGCSVDHIGNVWKTPSSMAFGWGITPQLLYKRTRNGWSLKDALETGSTSKPKKGDAIKVFGEFYPSHIDVDIAYGYAKGTSLHHKDNLEEWLMSREHFVIDGILYRSITKLAMAYGISDQCLDGRIRRGWDLYTAVHTPSARGHRGKPCVDHLGNTFESKSDMAQFYNISYATYKGRIRKGWSLKDALTIPVKEMLTPVAADTVKSKK